MNIRAVDNLAPIRNQINSLVSSNSRVIELGCGDGDLLFKKNGITEPFDISDNIDFIVLLQGAAKTLDNLFSLHMLSKGVITGNAKEGKRGMRVYPPWDIPSNKRAEKT
jgi:hypothetical protein